MGKQQRKKKNRKQSWKKIGKILLVMVLFTVSLGLILYPYISNYIFEHQADGIIETVEKEADKNKARYEADLEVARAYNQVLATGKIALKDPFNEEQEQEEGQEYDSLLNMTEDGVMGFIKIPCINVSLPIYHGTSGKVLEKGVGHLQGSSLPVGGESTHAILTGHTGLSSAKLFTDLTELEEGDYFFLHVMGEELAYVVDQISVILPSELDKLTIETGKDYCTLVTCTPYGVNTHRLLVRGHRTEYQEAAAEPANLAPKETASKWQEEYTKSLIAASALFILLMLMLVLVREIREKIQRKKKGIRKKKQKRRRKS